MGNGKMEVTGSNKDGNFTFTHTTRGYRKNFKDTTSYEYDGIKSDMEYRIHTQLCGSRIDECSKV